MLVMFWTASCLAVTLGLLLFFLELFVDHLYFTLISSFYHKAYKFVVMFDMLVMFWIALFLAVTLFVNWQSHYSPGSFVLLYNNLADAVFIN